MRAHVLDIDPAFTNKGTHSKMTILSSASGRTKGAHGTRNAPLPGVHAAWASSRAAPPYKRISATLETPAFRICRIRENAGQTEPERKRMLKPSKLKTGHPTSAVIIVQRVKTDRTVRLEAPARAVALCDIPVPGIGQQNRQSLLTSPPEAMHETDCAKRLFIGYGTLE